MKTRFFDFTQGDWDIRDARGRSARVYAPGAGKRERREKRWYERASFLKKAALAGALVGAGGLTYAATRKPKVEVRVRRVTPKTKAAPDVIDLRKDPAFATGFSRRFEFRRGDFALPALARRGLLGSDAKTRNRVLGAVRTPGPAVQLVRDRLAQALRSKPSKADTFSKAIP